MDTKTTYTTDEKSIYFLTDKSIARDLAGEIPAKNALPSFTLVADMSATAQKAVSEARAAETANRENLSGEVLGWLAAERDQAAAEVAAAETAAKTHADEKTAALDEKTAAALAKAIAAAELSVKTAKEEASTAASGLSAAIDLAVSNAKLSVEAAQDAATGQSAAVSAAVDAAGYAVAAATTFKYDQNTHILALEVAGKDGQKNYLSVDATAFIANSIVDHIAVKDGNIEVYWKNTSGSLENVSIPVDKLIQAYRAGDGIAIEKNISDGIYQVAADQSIARVVAVAQDIAAVRTTIAEVSASLDGSAEAKATAAKDAAIAKATELDAAMDVRTKALESYAAELSVAGGKIASLEAADADAASKIAANVEAIASNKSAAERAQATAETGVADAKKASEEALAEKNRAELQEQALSGAIDANAAATAGVAERTTALETRATNLEASAVDAASKIAAEKARAEQAEADLKASAAANAAAIQNLDQKTAAAAAALDTRTSTLEAKAESAASGITSLETKLAAETTRAEAAETALANEASKLATGVATVSADHEKRISAAEPKIAALEAFKTELSAGGENPGGVIPAIRSDVAALSNSLATSMAYSGKIAFSKKEPDAVLGSADAKLSSFLKGLNLDNGTETVKNGSVYGVSIMGTDDVSYPDDPALSDQLFKQPQDAWYLTEDGFRLADGDTWVVVSPDGAQTVALSALNADSFRRLNSIQAADFEQAKLDAWKSFAALSGGNTIAGMNTFTGDVLVNGSKLPSFTWADCYDTHPGNIAASRPSFAGRGNLAQVLTELTGDMEYAKPHLCVYIPLHIAGLCAASNANRASIDKKIFIHDKVNSAATLSSLSSQMENPSTSAAVAGEYLAALSGKHCDLSIVKISKTDYEALALGGVTLSNNVMYVVESDYIDAYGEVFKNLSTVGATGTSDAANVNYVDAKAQTVSAAASADIEYLSGQTDSIQTTLDSVQENANAALLSVSVLDARTVSQNGEIDTLKTISSDILNDVYTTLKNWLNSPGELSAKDPVVALQSICNTLGEYFAQKSPEE